MVRALLSGAIDYAGLFPPARLDMAAAVAEYLAHRASPDAWALGRFVVPVSGLEAFAAETGPVAGTDGRLIPVTALIGAATADDVEVIEGFNRECTVHGARVDAVEVKAATDSVVRSVLAAIPSRWARYVEIVALGSGTAASLDAIRRGAAFAKVRTGGTTPEAIPTPDRLLDFLAGAARRKVAFKATAGLHYPVRGLHPLTGSADGPSGVMYGYLNLMIAAAILWGGGDRSLARKALLESEISAFALNGDALLWHDLRFDGDALGRMRNDFCHGFGSCSFREPLEALPAWSGR